MDTSRKKAPLCGRGETRRTGWEEIDMNAIMRQQLVVLDQKCLAADRGGSPGFEWRLQVEKTFRNWRDYDRRQFEADIQGLSGRLPQFGQTQV